ncbi:DUF4365 domain-containing protein [Spongiactinospora sp. TRM90649]|uniref:DUF4365 domain-containing protein n=1 Tax=Spongiactinospora sp. TRM90649 TaxID=3031114 RepID=UPI0023F8F8B7|nr:DUF4365 domain-containing protein [Spongiactinospora sp. TRM90649]MDF5753101.1 DUF4365 domain-containing protein [Spongiactinospora sp. TRM90649]
MLDPRNHQGKFAEDYVRALASAAGLLVYQDDLDHDGIDLGFRYPGRTGYISSPAIEVQVKSWSAPICKGPELVFPRLTETQYNKLAAGPFLVPRYLFVVVVPPEIDRYARVETDGLILSRLCYYRGFDGEPPIPAPSKTRTRPVQLPLGNVLTVRALRELVGAPTGQPA